MGLVDLIVYKGLEALGRYYGTYRGIVIKEADLQNRIEVTIPSISKGKVLAYPLGQQGSQDSGFKWFSPSPGQIVYIQFLQGELAYPVWSYHGWGKDEVPSEFNSNNIAGFKSKRGHLITIDEEEGELSLIITNPTDQEKEVFNLTINKSGITLDVLEGDEATTSIGIGEEVILDTVKNVKINSEKDIIFNKGEEGLPLASKLATKMSDIENDLNTLRAALKLGAPGVAAIVSTFSPVVTWSTSKNLVPTTEDEISNPKIKQ